MKHFLPILFCLISFSSFSQKPDVLPIVEPEAKPKFKKETNIIIKGGVTANFLNREFYRSLNDGLKDELYKPENPSAVFINPYFSIGLENQFLKNFGFHFNIGFNQTTQKYTIYSNSNNSSNYNNKTYRVNATTQINNNVFAEILPFYKYKHTRFLAGFNLARYSPKTKTKITITNLSTGEVETFTETGWAGESYNAYSIVGIMHSFPVKTIEMTVSANYFGFLKKYDSGFNLMLGVLF